MKTPEDAKEKFENFISKKKFYQENFYPGIGDVKKRPVFTKNINEAALDFQSISESDNPTNLKYQEKIKIGLSRFSHMYLEIDTEDRERICGYFEELMDIVGLESSGGHLNGFMY
ncbi:DUF4844 domain-containing protein [Algibacter sp. 2305UL17-15]|uniref:DUF4844 domain-containing protein n=1 Tax=Algibacter sp. 2305UL17-15 TaxID=3231268 RepID=UPI0034598A77